MMMRNVEPRSAIDEEQNYNTSNNSITATTTTTTTATRRRNSGQHQIDIMTGRIEATFPQGQDCLFVPGHNRRKSKEHGMKLNHHNHQQQQKHDLKEGSSDQQQPPFQEEQDGAVPLHCFHFYKTGSYNDVDQEYNDIEDDTESSDTSSTVPTVMRESQYASSKKDYLRLHRDRHRPQRPLEVDDNGNNDTEGGEDEYPLNTSSNHSSHQSRSIASRSAPSSSASSSSSSGSIHGGSFGYLHFEQEQRPVSSSSSSSPPGMTLVDDEPVICWDEEDTTNPALVDVLKTLRQAQENYYESQQKSSRRIRIRSHMELAEGWNSLGLVRLHMQRDEVEALKCHDHALMILDRQIVELQERGKGGNEMTEEEEEEYIRTNQLNRGLTIHDIGYCLERLNDLTRALQRYNEALQIFQTTLGLSDDHPRVISAVRAVDRIARKHEAE